MYGPWRVLIRSFETEPRRRVLSTWSMRWVRATTPMILNRRSVVILDETGMARSDDLAKLLAAVEQADAKLVLAGDPHQLG